MPERDVRVGDRQYLVHESGEAVAGTATVLLVHGIGMTHASLDAVQRELPSGLRVLNVDLAGFGSTERPRHAVPVEEYAADLAEIVDRLDAWPVVAAGHSMGTQVVLELARLRPDQVSTIMMVGPVVDVARDTVLQQARDTIGRVSERVADGNRKVFAELAPLFVRFAEAMAAPPADRLAHLDAFVASLRPGASDQDGQDVLRRAFVHYAAAAEESDACTKAQLILLGNCYIGLHEQTRLQDDMLVSDGA